MNPLLNLLDGYSSTSEIIAEADRLNKASEKDIERIKAAASSCREELRKQIAWSEEEERANIEVRRIRATREFERLLQERLGVGPTQVGPIRKLPIELLSYIFRYYVDSDMSPWRLAKVCKDWMRTALATPYLWRYILIKPVPPLSSQEWIVDGKKRISHGNMQLCRTITQLRKALLRSGAVPLHIKVDCMNTRGGMVDPINVEGSLVSDSNLPLFLALLKDPLSQRIEYLNITYLLTPPPFPQPSNRPVGHFSHLRELLLPDQHHPWIDVFMKSISLTATRIETLRLRGEVRLESTKHSFWPLLKTLQIGRPGQFNDIAGKLLDLEELAFGPRAWPNERTPFFTWKKARKINVECHPRYLSRASPPSLESLELNDIRYSLILGDTIGEYDPVSFPKLTRLVLRTPDPQWLLTLSAPLLSELTMRCSSPESRVLPNGGSIVFNALAFPAVETLTLTTSWNDSVLVDMLSSMPRLVTVSLVSTIHRSSDFGLVLLERLSGSEPLICPNLASFSLGTWEHPVYTLKKHASPLVKRLATSRRKNGSPLRVLSVRWSKARYDPQNYV